MLLAADAVPSLPSSLLELVLSPSGLAMLASVVGGILGVLAGTQEVRRRRIALAVYHAFHIVEDLSRETDSQVDDKAAAGLQALDAYLLANGWRQAKPGEQELAKLQFQALNGASALAAKVAAAAVAPVVPGTAPAVPPQP